MMEGLPAGFYAGDIVRVALEVRVMVPKGA